MADVKNPGIGGVEKEKEISLEQSTINGWGIRANENESSGAKPKVISLASIMADEVEIKKQREDDEHKRNSESEEDIDIMVALQKSLRESASLEKQYDEEVEKAIAMSLQEEHDTSSEKASLSLEKKNSSHDRKEGIAKVLPSIDDDYDDEGASNLTAREMQEIELALTFADREEELKSLQLALQLQEEEKASAWRPTSRQSQGHVRVMTHSQLWEEKTQANESSAGKRQLYSADSCSVLDEDDKEEEHGFRINSSNPSGTWSRVDRSTIVGPNNELRTKHDIELHGLANAHRLGLDISSAYDGEIESQKLTSVGNKAFNSFRQSMQKKTVKGVAAHGHGRAAQETGGTRGGAMDTHVRRQISKAINNDLIENFNGVVKEGKEAIVYHAEEGKNSGGFDVAVKVFKRIQEFKQRGMYVDGDPRYLGNKFSQASTREKLEIWTEKEYRNLVRANRSGVPVPTPLLYKENILFMRFLGEDGFPSPQIRELQLKHGGKKWTILYEQTMAAVKLLYQKSHLVHADLSEYNILVCPCRFIENSILQDDEYDENALQIVLIDFGQAVDIRHLSALDFLRRDLLRIKEFFDKKGVKSTMKIDIAEEFVIACDEDNSEENEREEN